MASARLFHIGSAVVDLIYRLGRLPAPGDDLTASAFDALPGGGFNMMVAARRSGMEVTYAGRIGNGPFGHMLEDAFAAENIDCPRPATSGMDSGTCVVLITEDAERTFVSMPGAEGDTTPGDYEDLPLEQGDWVFTSGYTLAYPGSRDAQADLIESLPDAIIFGFDPTGIVSEIPGDILARVLARTDWLSLNRSEAATIAGTGTDREIAVRLLGDYCPRAAGIILRAGADGAVLAMRGRPPDHVPAFQVAAIDTNGAGDVHDGAFIAALARGESPLEALRYANAAAAISTTRHGGCDAPETEEIAQFLTSAREANTA